MSLVDYESCDPAPRPTVVGYRNKEVRGGPDEGSAVVSDKHIGSSIAEHLFKPTAEHVGRLRMAQLIKKASELIGILEPGRPNGHCTHLGRSMNA